MVDDVICASKCGPQVVASNSTVTSFVELTKVRTKGEKKCARLEHCTTQNCDVHTLK